MTLNSLNQSMDKAVKHYSSMFKLPSYARVVLFLALVCFGGSLLSALFLYPSLDGLLGGFLLGASLLSVNLIVDHAVSMMILRGDPIFDFRRTAAVSLVCMVFWLFFVILGSVIATFFGLAWWVRLTLLGSSAALILRLVVFSSTSRLEYPRLLVASFLQPAFCMIPFLFSFIEIHYPVTIPTPLFLAFSAAIGLMSSHLFLFLLNRIGKQTLGVPSFSLLKAFLLNWVLDLNAPFEQLLEKLGEEQDVEVSIIKLDSSKPKALIAVPCVHPGPFKNIGSSILPSMLKSALEKELGCVVCVPHGLFGHELDLASQGENHRLIAHVVKSARFETSETKASPFVTVGNGVATACCQVFGNSVFISFTLAPETTEDFPKELGLFVQEECKKSGLACSVVVNAHNSINGIVDMHKMLDSLKAVATACLEKVSSLKRVPFEAGAASVVPNEFTLSDGMGRGGITVVVIRVGDQKTAYVVIDGNNMVTGLRERVLSALRSIGIDQSEVFTTDTHTVNALVLSNRGYHPVGEAMNHDRLISYIKEATVSALTALERVKVGCCTAKISKAKVIGEKQLETLCVLIDKSIQKAKRIAVPIFAGSGLALMLFLLIV